MLKLNSIAERKRELTIKKRRRGIMREIFENNIVSDIEQRIWEYWTQYSNEKKLDFYDTRIFLCKRGEEIKLGCSMFQGDDGLRGIAPDGLSVERQHCYTIKNPPWVDGLFVAEGEVPETYEEFKQILDSDA